MKTGRTNEEKAHQENRIDQFGPLMVTLHNLPFLSRRLGMSLKHHFPPVVHASGRPSIIPLTF